MKVLFKLIAGNDYFHILIPHPFSHFLSLSLTPFQCFLSRKKGGDTVFSKKKKTHIFLRLFSTSKAIYA
jgi:hypothetical protein